MSRHQKTMITLILNETGILSVIVFIQVLVRARQKYMEEVEKALLCSRSGKLFVKLAL